jgi:anti-sigma B factor antagonist
MSVAIQHRRWRNVDVIHVSGRIVLGETASLLRDAIRDAVKRNYDVLLNLSWVTYIDSAGLGEMIAGYSAVTASGREMKLLRPAERVDSLLHVTKLYSTFEVFEEEATALASFPSR